MIFNDEPFTVSELTGEVGKMVLWLAALGGLTTVLLMVSGV